MLYDPKWTPGRPYVVKRKNISKHDIDLLLRIREGLKDGTISKRRFKMDTLSDHKKGCGTVGCIAGWMGFLEMIDDEVSKPQMAMNAINETSHYFSRLADPKFYGLFHPFSETPWSELTPAMGVVAIDRFLAGDDQPWKGLAE